MKRWRCASPLFGLFVCACAPVWGASLGLQVAPAIIEEQMVRGQSQEFAITVTNCGDREITADVFPADLELSPEGLPLVRAAGSLPNSCARWLDVATRSLLLPPGQAQVVPIRIRVPLSARGGGYGVVAVRATMPDDADGNPIGMGVVGTTGTVMMLTVKGPATVRAEASELIVQSGGENGELQFAVDVRNTGNIHFRCSGQLVVYGPDGRVAFRMPLQAGTGTVLPGGLRRLTAQHTTARIAAGSYRAKASILVPSFRTLQVSTDFEIR